MTVILYIAASLDGYIAREDGDVSWLEIYGESGEDYGYPTFFAGIDALVMGSRTYEQIVGFGEWPYGDKPVYVVSGRRLPVPERANVTFLSGTPHDLALCMRRRNHKNVWLVGGASLAGQFLRDGLVDEIILTVIPVLLGGGIALFGRLGSEVHLALLGAETYPAGVVQLRYAIQPG
ncbi:hypothetical protein ABH15_09810 [Methanoculleus taiwanensis]|uniref:Bacterial bifunctional deaminase-reductase C-terminal domain-containing protein n=1 Tax=Methanoculleus taiwanensis TaxID=1550565 RepID=A0A498H0D0_9EURY|nr:dihydrofolate reductase family protein [Methanoculleus taiwanensis]RXE56379.1 hypothetical protein ABH15_09810 [Methanoculleus taiwanensis]